MTLPIAVTVTLTTEEIAVANNALQRLTEIRNLLDEQGIWKDNPDLMARVEFALGLLGTTADNYANAAVALEELRHRNRLRNDTDSYLYHLAAYGLGMEQKPNPADWGVT